MQSIALPVPPRHWSATQRRATRFAPRCAPLEERQLLSIGQTGAAAASPPSPTAPSAPISETSPTSNITVSNPSSIATEVDGSAGGSSNPSQAGTGLDDLVNSSIPVLPSAGTVAVTATFDTFPAGGETGVGFALLPESVSVLNPDMTSSTAAFTDDQVDADAYLIPSSTDLLDDHLGVSTMSALLHPSTNGNALANPPASGVFLSSNTGPGASTGNNNTGSGAGIGGGPVSGFGQSAPAPPGISPSSLSSPHLGEPSEPAAPGGGNPSQPVPQGGQSAPPLNAPQPASPQGGQAAPPAATPQPGTPAAPGGQAPAPERAPSSPPQGEEAPSSGTAQIAPLLPTSDSVVDAAIDLTDVRLLVRSRGADAFQMGEQSPDTDTARSFSAVFGAALVVTGGYQAAAGRLTGRRFALSSSGAERPSGRKNGQMAI